jgi:thiol-disulfide isomerase/thioredoxin
MRHIRNGALALAVLTGSVSLSVWSGAEPAPVKSGPALVAVDAGGLKQQLARLRGKVVVLNMWATWCQPCVHEFPDLVKLDRKHRSRGVAVIGLSVDDPQQAQRLVPPFLAKQQAKFPIFITKSGDPSAIVRPFDKYWDGAIPITYFFDRTGKLKTRLQGARSLDAFEMALKPLL